MAKIILKWRYTKPGQGKHNSNLVKYIATRENVDKIDDSWKHQPVSQAQEELIQTILQDFPGSKDSHEYMDYLSTPSKGTASEFISQAIENNMDQIDKRDNYVRYIAHRPGAERFGTHGLFTDAGVPVDVAQVAEEVANHQGIVMTQILSIRREDAARLNYENGEAWRDMLRGQASKMAEAMQIPLEDLRWYAAYHNEAHHPHCHIVTYSAGKEPYLSEEALLKLKSAYAGEIFRQDLVQIYAQQTRHRDDLSTQVREHLQTLMTEPATMDNQHLTLLMEELSLKLKVAKGKKVYGYLPQPARNLVNNIVDELAKEDSIAKLYDLWYEQRVQIVRTYQDKVPERLPLSQNKTFHSVKNIIIKEVLSYTNGETIFPPDATPEPEFRTPEFPKTMPPGVVFGDDPEVPESLPKEISPPVLNAYSAPIIPTDSRKSANVYLAMGLMSAVAKVLQSQIQIDNQQIQQIDKKLRQKIAEKKQAQGLKMG